jgi:hypothetical protein
MVEGKTEDQKNCQKSQKNANHHSSFPPAPVMKIIGCERVKQGKSIPLQVATFRFQLN